MNTINKTNRAIFLDRDGVLNQTVFRMGKPRAPYSLEELELYPGVIEAVEKLKTAGFHTIIVTNQPDVARGWVSMERVEEVNQKIMQWLKVDEIRCCFHVTADNCPCRKPRPGMILDGCAKWEIDPARSYMIGDRFSDIEAGRSAGCRTILIGPGDDQPDPPAPDYNADSLLEASRWILNHE